MGYRTGVIINNANKPKLKKSLNDMREVYKILAYGSLINQTSLKTTVPEARNIVLANTYGL